MASTPTSTANGPVAPKHYAPPSARERRSQNVQRLQVGLSGLAAMLLIVGLANIIMDRAKLADLGSAPVASPSPSAGAPKNDPLAEMGVVPSASATATTAGGGGGTVAPVPSGARN